MGRSDPGAMPPHHPQVPGPPAARSALTWAPQAVLLCSLFLLRPWPQEVPCTADCSCAWLSGGAGTPSRRTSSGTLGASLGPCRPSGEEQQPHLIHSAHLPRGLGLCQTLCWGLGKPREEFTAWTSGQAAGEAKCGRRVEENRSRRSKHERVGWLRSHIPHPRCRFCSFSFPVSPSSPLLPVR